MKKNLIFLTFLLSLVFIIPKTSLAILSCNFSSSSCDSGQISVLELNSSENAHAALPDQNFYPNFICCGGVSGLSNNCSGSFGVLAKLVTPTNAHIEQNNQDNYRYNACLSAQSGGNVSIGYGLDCDDFDTTVASFYGTNSAFGITNAHIAKKDFYPNKICASAEAPSFSGRGSSGGVGSSGGSSSSSGGSGGGGSSGGHISQPLPPPSPLPPSPIPLPASSLIQASTPAGLVSGGDGYMTLSPEFISIKEDTNASKIRICRKYFTKFAKLSNLQNDSLEVKKIQEFLTKDIGLKNIPSTGFFDQVTFAGVKDFQRMYFERIMKPYNIISPTGFWYVTTRKTANEILCEKVENTNDLIISELDQSIYVPVYFEFKRDLFQGLRGVDVKNLQRFLNITGFSISSAGRPGSLDYETEYFGQATKEALFKFQAKYDLLTGKGKLDMATRIFIKDLIVIKQKTQ